jgi:multidrug resistance efflux pump
MLDDVQRRMSRIEAEAQQAKAEAQQAKADFEQANAATVRPKPLCRHSL